MRRYILFYKMAHKLSKYMDTIGPAMDGDLDLRKEQKVYKKICKYYKDLGANFSGDSEEDYNLVLDCLYEDLY